jgi:hypothetical protein
MSALFQSSALSYFVHIGYHRAVILPDFGLENGLTEQPAIVYA